MRVTVVGAGIIGTTAAYRIKKKYPELTVSLIADRFSPNTTSDIAAGWWEPHLDPDTDPHLIEKWSGETYSLLLALWTDNDHHETADIAQQLRQGVSLTTGTCVDSSEGLLNPTWTSQVLNYTVHNNPCSLTRLGYASSPGMFAHSFLSFSLEPRIVLPVFYTWLKHNGVHFQERKLNDLREVAGPDHLVVNCTGLGAAQLGGDSALFPISGHVIRAKVPELKQCLADNRRESWAYVIPNRDCVVLGSVDVENDWETTVKEENTRKILTNCQFLCPGVKECDIISESVGLRPCRRGGVRLQLETLPGGGKVIHNYGHGGSGVTLSWGCAGEVVHILDKVLHPVQPPLVQP